MCSPTLTPNVHVFLAMKQPREEHILQSENDERTFQIEIQILTSHVRTYTHFCHPLIPTLYIPTMILIYKNHSVHILTF